MPAFSIATGTGNVESLNAMRVNVQDYGAVADNSTDCSSAFEAAYAALQASLNANNFLRGEIYWPGATQPYVISRPMLIEDDNVWVVGDGTASRIENRTAGPCVLLGLRESDMDGASALELDSTYRPDCFGKIDTSGAASSGTRWGIRTKDNACVIFSHGPADMGVPDAQNFGLDGWSTINKLTIEIAVEPGTGTQFGSGGQGGFFMLGGYGGAPEICSLIRGGGTNQFDLKTTDAAGNTGTASLQAASDTGVLKLCWQIDLSGATRICRGYINGTQVAVTTSGAFWTTVGATTFAKNSYSPFIIGGYTATADNRVPVGVTSGGTGMDCNIYGLQLSTDVWYANNGVGTAQARLDAGTVNDNYRFGQGGKTDNKILFQLYRTDSPVTDPTKRRVTAYSGTSAGLFLGWFVQNRQFLTLGGVKNNGLEDLQLIGRGQKFQATVEIGGVLHLHINRCRITGGTWAIANINMLANYFNTIRDCRLSGSLGDIYLAWSDTRVYNCLFENSGRCAVRAWASNAYMYDCQIAQFNENAEYAFKVHKGSYGSITVITNYLIDAEGGTCSTASLGFEHFDDQPTSVYIDTVYVGSTADGVSIIELIGKTSPTVVSKITAKRILPGTATVGWDYVATITKTSWTGTIEVLSSTGLTLNNVDSQTAVTLE